MIERKIKGKKSLNNLKDDSKNTTWYSGFGSDFMTNESTYFLPFIPQKYNLDEDTIALNVTHPSTGFKQIDTHSLMGHMQSKITYEVLSSGFADELKDKRPFLMSRSTFAGSGQYAQHWIGDQDRTF